jgi:hypothetical protein
MLEYIRILRLVISEKLKLLSLYLNFVLSVF